jgi:hypothetical protein
VGEGQLSPAVYIKECKIMQITGGTGSNYAVGVTSDNRLRTYSGQESEIAFQSRVNENAYSWTMSADLGADECAIYLRNDSEIPLLIDKIFIWGSAAATYEIYAGNNKITVAGTAVTGVNLNTDSTKTPEATCTHTETGADAGGTLTLIQTIQSGVAAKETVEWNGALVLGRLGEIAVNVVTDIALTSVTILGYFQPIA